MTEQSNEQRTVRNTNRLFLGTLCFVMAVSFWMGRSGISLSGEMNLIVSQLLFWIPIVICLAVTKTNPLHLIPFRKI